MDPNHGNWNIHAISDLLLGADRNASASSLEHARFQQPGTYKLDSQFKVLCLSSHTRIINPDNVYRYADFWSNRGEIVIVLWAGSRATELTVFDARHQTHVAQPIFDAIELGQFDLLPELLVHTTHRLVLYMQDLVDTHIANLAQSIKHQCLIMGISPQERIRGYEYLKQLSAGESSISIFLVGVDNDQQARNWGRRMQEMAHRFLNRVIHVEGYALESLNPGLNLTGRLPLNHTIRNHPEFHSAMERICLPAKQGFVH